LGLGIPALTGCLGRASVTRACDHPVVSAPLGRSSSFGQPAEFSTDGSTIYLTGSGYAHGGLLDSDKGSTAVSFGRIETPLTFGYDGFVLHDVVKDVVVREGELSAVDLPPGRYWAVDSDRDEITVDGCMSGAVTDAKQSVRVTSRPSSIVPTTR